MDSSKFLLLLISLICAFAPIVLSQDTNRGNGRRVLMGFKETPTGSNFTFECSPSGPCVACSYSEKRDDKYRCSETGYRIPLKCVELGSGKKEANGEKGNRRFSSPESYNSEIKSDGTMPRSLLAATSKSDHKSQAYITYRSCVPTVNEEKLSMLGFEGIVLILLSMSGSFIYLRRKQNDSPSGNGAVRFQLVFRGIVLILLSMSGSVIYFRWKQNNSPSGNGDGIVLILLSMSCSFIYFKRKQNNSLSGNGAVRFQLLRGIVLILLSMNGSFIYFRWKHNNSPSGNGGVRIPTSPRF